jgi:ribosomal protein S12 methylthiotransferase accessory factor
MTNDRVTWLLPNTTLTAADVSTVIREVGGRVSTVKNSRLAHLVNAMGGRVTGPTPFIIPASERAETGRVVDYLTKQGVVAQAARGASPELLSVAVRCGVEATGVGAAVDVLMDASIDVHQLDPSVGDLADLLSTAGMRVSQNGVGKLTLIVCDDILDSEAVQCLGRLWQDGREVILGSVGGRFLSPVFRRGSSVCPECVWATVGANRPTQAYIERTMGIRLGAATSATGADRLMFAVAAAQAMARNLLSDGWRLKYATSATVISPDGARRMVPMFSRPDCRSCDTSPQPVYGSVDVTFGLIRTVEVTRVGEKLWVGRAEHSLITSDFRHDSMAAVVHAYRAFSEGKGDSPQRAIENAAAEVVERRCGVFHQDVPVVWGRAADLTAPALTPIDLTSFSDQQYADRVRLNRLHSDHNRVPHRFDPSVRMPWTTAVPFDEGEPVLLPCAYAYTDADHFLDVPDAQRFLAADSNGCASATSVEDACRHGLLELIERDAVAIWWYNRLRMPRVGPDVRNRSLIRQVEDLLDSRDRALYLLDLTQDLGVPVCAAVAPLRTYGITGSSEIIVGFGAGLTSGVAAERAALEALQFLPMLDRLPKDGRRFARHGPDSQAWWAGTRIEDERWLAPDDGVVPMSHRDLRTLDDLVAALDSNDLRAFWIDQTQRRFSLSVVRVIVPGLRHFWRQLGPGRLYEVPTATGRLTSATAEQELNPLSVFF